MTHAKSRRLWQSRVANYESSGLTMRDWCERNGFGEGQLRYWLRKARETGFIEKSGKSWACVDLVDDGISDSREPGVDVTRDPAVTIRVGAATIEIGPGFDSALLSEVLRVVTSTC